MQLVGDVIVRVYHSGGIDQDGVVVDNYAIVLKSGRCIDLGWDEITETTRDGMEPDPAFDWCIGMTITAVEKGEHWPTWGLRLENGSALTMGSPVPYYWGLYQEIE
jgi:hypothetical protein